MTEKTVFSKDDASGVIRSFNIRREGKHGSDYYVERSEDGEVKDRTWVLVPAATNVFFSRQSQIRPK